MSEKIKYAVEVTAYTRNGLTRQIGMEIIKFANRIELAAINTKGFTTVGYLQIPIESIDEVIEALQKMKQ